MTDLTPTQCETLSRLAAWSRRTGHQIEWRIADNGDRRMLQFRHLTHAFVTMWHTLLWSRDHELFALRVQTADAYYDTAGAITDMLDAAQEREGGVS